MAASLRNGLCFAAAHDVEKETKERAGVGLSRALAWKNEFKGRQIVLREERHTKSHFNPSILDSVCVPGYMRWWERSIKANMIEIHSAQHLVDLLLHAGDKLVVVDFYSPSCGGCRALHPKICQLAEQNSNALFLQVNYEEHRSMCSSLHVHVLPFFRLYRGVHGRVCSFSCTNATIHKFKDALAKHGSDSDWCGLGPARGLEESELLRLSWNKEAGFSYPAKSEDFAASGL